MIFPLRFFCCVIKKPVKFFSAWKASIIQPGASSRVYDRVNENRPLDTVFQLTIHIPDEMGELYFPENNLVPLRPKNDFLIKYRILTDGFPVFSIPKALPLG